MMLDLFSAGWWPPSRGKAWRFFILIAVLGVFACSDKTPEDRPLPDPIPVTVETARRISQHRTVQVSGSIVSPDNPARVAFQVAGRVLDVAPREGDWVTVGQKLAGMDTSDYQQAVRAAEAQVAQARIGRDRANAEYERMRFLYERKSLAPNDFEKFEAQWKLAKAKLKEARAGLAIQRKRLTDTTLCAPTNGFITKRLVEPGQTIDAGMPAFEIATLDPVEIKVGVPETDVARVRAGQKATVGVTALGGETFEGTVRLINVGADSQTRTYMTRILVPNVDHRLKIGMVASVSIATDETYESMTLPVGAIVRDPQGAPLVYVYFPEKNCVYGSRVTIGEMIGQRVVIRSGLSGDEQVVVAGQDKLMDGTRVTVTHETKAVSESGSAS